MSDLGKMTRKQFLEIEEHYPTEPFNGFVIVPTGKKHDSGYGCMRFILECHGKIVGAVGGWADVVHLNGIGGYGLNWERTLSTGTIEVTDWNIDLLPTSKCLRVFSSRELKIEDIICSDFEVFATERMP